MADGDSRPAAPITRRSSSPVLFVVDDDQHFRGLAARWLSPDYAVEALADGQSCLRALTQNIPEAVCLDLGLPDLSGLQALERIKARHPHLPVVIVTGDDSAASAVEALRRGAYDYLTKPVAKTELVTTLAKAVEHGQLTTRLRQLEREAEQRGYPKIVGASPAMMAMYRELDRVAPTDAVVMIRGESGTGKELIARAIHDGSSRAAESFVALNCAAVPESLLESELFGHERGAFTGALARRLGRFEQADGGTIFLDEIGELSLPLQAKLLRVVQERRFSRVGGDEEISSDFRLISATHRSLEEMVQAGLFREDLYYRLAVFELEVPPLRARDADVHDLAQHFIEALRPGEGLTLSADVLGLLERYPWPGNVRELENAIRRAVVVADDTLRPEHLPARILRELGEEAVEGMDQSGVEGTAGALPASRSGAELFQVLPLREVERRAIMHAYEATGRNISEMTRLLRVGRTTLYRKLKSYGVAFDAE